MEGSYRHWHQRGNVWYVHVMHMYMCMSMYVLHMYMCMSMYVMHVYMCMSVYVCINWYVYLHVCGLLTCRNDDHTHRSRHGNIDIHAGAT